jgi:hypothetical protein
MDHTRCGVADSPERRVHVNGPSRRLCTAVDTAECGAARLEVNHEVVSTHTADELTEPCRCASDGSQQPGRRRPWGFQRQRMSDREHGSLNHCASKAVANGTRAVVSHKDGVEAIDGNQGESGIRIFPQGQRDFPEGQRPPASRQARSPVCRPVLDGTSDGN